MEPMARQASPASHPKLIEARRKKIVIKVKKLPKLELLGCPYEGHLQMVMV